MHIQQIQWDYLIHIQPIQSDRLIHIQPMRGQSKKAPMNDLNNPILLLFRHLVIAGKT